MCLLKLGASFLLGFLLVGMMAATFVGQSALATPPPCSQSTAVVSATAVPAACTVGLTAFDPSGALSLASTPNAVVTPNATTDIPTFSFNSTVADDRSSTAGWTLQASSDGLFNGADSVEPSLTSVDAITGVPTITDGLCGTLTNDYLSSPLLLTSTAATFLSLNPDTTAINCADAFTTNGSIDFTGKTSGLYTGSITLTLLNTKPLA
jgi:hypothetical protein